MKKMNKRISLFLILSIIFSNLILISPVNAYWKGGYHHEGDIRYTVGIAHYDIWRDSGGNWTSDGRPDTVEQFSEIYNFTFPDRKVKSVGIFAYTGQMPEAWEASRSEMWTDIERYSSTSINPSSPSSLTGIGTSSVSFRATGDVLLTAYIVPRETTKDWQGEKVRGERYEIPLLFKIELYPPEQLEVEVQHFNKQTGERLKPDEEFEVEPNTSITRNKESFTGMTYLYNVISEDDGATFKDMSESPTRTKTITQNTIIRFYYLPAGELVADLEINANPSVIEKGKTATVQFTLNAGGSRGTYPIKKYEFWFGDSSSFKSTYDYSTSNNAWVTSKSGVKPNSTWYGKVKVYDSHGNEDEATAQVTIGEIEPNKPVEIRSILWITSDDEKVIDSGSGWIKVKLPYKTIRDNKKFDLDVKLDGSYSSSTNGISNYHFNLYNEGWEEDSSSPVIFQSIELYPFQVGIGGSLVVTDSLSGETAYSNNSLDIIYVAERVPPEVELTINKEKFFYGETAIFTPTFFEDADGTFPIERREWEIKKSDGTVKLSGEGEIPNELILNWENGTYRAIQRIYYLDDDKIEGSAEGSVSFQVKTPISTPVIKAYMLNDTAGNWIEVTNNNKAKVYKRIKLDISDSIGATDPETQSAYPIQFNSDRTQIQIIPITETGEFDSERNIQIHTYNRYDKSTVEDRITFKGKEIQKLRIDAPGQYKIRAKVYNGFMDSDWTTAYMEVKPDLPPKITAFDFENVDKHEENKGSIDFREPDTPEQPATERLKTNFTVRVNYEAQDDDIPDPNTAKLEVRYDKNNNDDASDDGEYSKMYINKTNTNLKGLATAVKTADMKKFDITVLNPLSNSLGSDILGKFRFEYSIGENPSIPNYTGGDLPSVPQQRGDSSLFGSDKKNVFIDNRKAIIRIIVGKNQKFKTILMNFRDDDTSIQDIAKALRKHYGDDVIIEITGIEGEDGIIRY